MCESIARSYDSKATPRTASSSCERVKIRPGLAAIVASRPNSVAVSSTVAAGDLGPHPRHVEDDVAGPDEVARAVGRSERRRTALTRATSSRGENGFVR